MPYDELLNQEETKLPKEHYSLGKKKHYWWRYLLCFLLGGIIMPLSLIGTVVGIAAFMPVSTLIKFFGLNPHDILADEYQDKKLLELTQDLGAIFSGDSINSLSEVRAITPLVDNIFDTLNDFLYTTTGSTIDPEKLYDANFTNDFLPILFSEVANNFYLEGMFDRFGLSAALGPTLTSFLCYSKDYHCPVCDEYYCDTSLLSTQPGAPLLNASGEPSGDGEDPTVEDVCYYCPHHTTTKLEYILNPHHKRALGDFFVEGNGLLDSLFKDFSLGDVIALEQVPAELRNIFAVIKDVLFLKNGNPVGDLLSGICELSIGSLLPDNIDISKPPYKAFASITINDFLGKGDKQFSLENDIKFGDLIELTGDLAFLEVFKDYSLAELPEHIGDLMNIWVGDIIPRDTWEDASSANYNALLNAICTIGTYVDDGVIVIHEDDKSYITFSNIASALVKLDFKVFLQEMGGEDQVFVQSLLNYDGPITIENIKDVLFSFKFNQLIPFGEEDGGLLNILGELSLQDFTPEGIYELTIGDLLPQSDDTNAIIKALSGLTIGELSDKDVLQNILGEITLGSLTEGQDFSNSPILEKILNANTENSILNLSFDFASLFDNVTFGELMNVPDNCPEDASITDWLLFELKDATFDNFEETLKSIDFKVVLQKFVDDATSEIFDNPIFASLPEGTGIGDLGSAIMALPLTSFVGFAQMYQQEIDGEQEFEYNEHEYYFRYSGNKENQTDNRKIETEYGQMTKNDYEANKSRICHMSGPFKYMFLKCDSDTQDWDRAGDFAIGDPNSFGILVLNLTNNINSATLNDLSESGILPIEANLDTNITFLRFLGITGYPKTVGECTIAQLISLLIDVLNYIGGGMVGA